MNTEPHLFPSVTADHERPPNPATPGADERFQAALQQWRAAIGPEHLLTDQATLDDYSRCTLPRGTRPLAVLRPGSTQEVSRVAAIATQYRVPIYPISCGKNWGYGDRCAPTDGQVIVELSRMNRILEVNTELAYAVVEPGVTQQQLYEFLQQHNIPLWIDPTGAGPTASILGNTVERGYGITPYGDHFAQLAGMEIVLPTGEVLQTGFGHYANARAWRVFPRGIGPYLDGLFTQSNFGIVTSIGVWLMPAAPHVELCLFSAERDQAIDQLVDRVRWLLLHRVLVGAVNLMHRNRILTVLRHYPWELMGGATPMSDDVARQLAAQRQIGTWNGVAALYGTRRQVAAARAEIRRVLKGSVDRLAFVSEAKLRLARRFPRLVKLATGMDVGQLLAAVEPALGIVKGKPNAVSLNTCWWRSKRPPPTTMPDPHEHGCGVIWFSPVIPMTAGHLREFRQLAEPILAKYRFDCCITLTAVNPRAFDCTLPVLYDPDDPQDAKRAADCHRELLSACAAAGYLPYRVDIHSMPLLTSEASVFWNLCRRLKDALDPHHLLAPKRYEV
jgi:4-cresol dehydrogenase (hydroxylating)